MERDEIVGREVAKKIYTSPTTTLHLAKQEYYGTGFLFLAFSTLKGLQTMSDNEQNIRNAIGVYRFNAIMGMVKGTAVVLAAAGGLYLSLTDGMQNANTTGWLYKNLGPEGLKLLAIALCVAALLVGLWWAYTSFRDLTVGVKAYKDELNEQGIGLKTYKAERNGQSPITARPYDM